MARPNKLGNRLSVNLCIPEDLYDLIQCEMKRQQQDRPGSFVTIAEIIRTGMYKWLGDNRPKERA